MDAPGLLTPDALRIGHDDAWVTPPEKCRYDACVVVPPDFTGDPHVNILDLPGVRYAVSRFAGRLGCSRASLEQLLHDQRVDPAAVELTHLAHDPHAAEAHPLVEGHAGLVEGEG